MRTVQDCPKCKELSGEVAYLKRELAKAVKARDAYHVRMLELMKKPKKRT